MWQKDGYLIVIGASAGGMNAIRQLLAGISPAINAAVCIVLHVSPKGSSDLFVERLQKSTAMPCSIAADDLPLEKGHVYLAAADYHMIIKNDKLLLGKGPAESRWRPSIDVAMRSAAVAWDTHSIGIVLSGLLNDGVAGMDAIKRCGGFTIVQDPLEAEYPDMPQATLNRVPTDRCVSLSAMGDILEAHISAAIPRGEPPGDIREEAILAEQVASHIDHMRDISDRHTYYTCPDCGGGLWEIRNGKIVRYRCHIGHTFTESDLLDSQAQKIEDTLWIALRMMEERRHLLLNMAGKDEKRGYQVLAGQHEERAREVALHIERLKEFLFANQKTDIHIEETS
jgi:two-component system chemotaxis response regulator CheB